MLRLVILLVLATPLALLADGGQRTRRPPVKPMDPGIREDDFAGGRAIPIIPKRLLDDRMMGVILNPNLELAVRFADLVVPAWRHRSPEVIEER